MKLSEAMRNIHPGALDAIKQAWNDWREALKRAHPPADTDDAAHYAKLDEIADVLEEQFFQFSAARGSGNWSRPRWSVCHSRQFDRLRFLGAGAILHRRRRTKMKAFVSALTLGLILAFSAPAFAGTSDAPKTKAEQSTTAKHQEKTAKHQEKKPMY